MFLKDSESIATQINALISDNAASDPVLIAVAFWGSGAEKLLSKSESQFLAICNLRSGGTNPRVIEAIMKLSNVEMRQLDSLHAKVVISRAGAVVSSANLSTNGLGLEGANTWEEAGIFVPKTEGAFSEVTQWFSALWSSCREIKERDLIDAENAWNKRAFKQQPSISGNTEQLPSEENEPTTESKGSAEPSLLKVQTVHFEGRIKPPQRNLRAAAAIIALNGEKGGPMPLSTFVFLFSGGKTRRAFDNHKEKFVVSDDGTVKLHKDFIGYFVGEDRTMASCTDTKRKKGWNAVILDETANWMLRKGARPAELEGVLESGAFLDALV